MMSRASAVINTLHNAKIRTIYFFFIFPKYFVKFYFLKMFLQCWSIFDSMEKKHHPENFTAIA